MRIFKILLIVFVFTLFNDSSVFANKNFLQLNSDLRRVGIDAILKIKEIEFESGTYRLDSDFTLGYGDVLILNFWGKGLQTNSTILMICLTLLYTEMID